jgi:hypothetical protein
MEKKSEGKDFTITTMGKTYNIKREDAIKIMVDAADMNDLTFKHFKPTDGDNWYGIAGPYLDFFVGFGLRLNEQQHVRVVV